MVKTKKPTTEIKLLNPKSADVKYTGSEPAWKLVLTDGDRTSAMLKSFAWYNYHYSKKDAKDMIAHWLEHNDRSRDAKLIRGIPDSQIRSTTAWVCRMNLIGLALSEHELSVIDGQISDMMRIKQEVVKVVTEEETVQARLTIQDHLRERMRVDVHMKTATLGIPRTIVRLGIPTLEALDVLGKTTRSSHDL